MAGPNRPVDMPIEKKRKRVERLRKALERYRNDPELLKRELDSMGASAKGSYADGCFDPDAEGYDLYAISPIEQGVQIILFDKELNPGTAGMFGYFNWQRMGDVLNAMRNKKYFLSLPGMGPKRYENLKSVISNHGFPVDWLE